MRNSFLIAVALLLLGLQSCTVYNKTWISMDEAIQMEKKQKVMIADPESEDYWENIRVTMHGDTLFGGQLPNNLVTGHKKNDYKYSTPIPESYRNHQVYLENKKKSRTATIIAIALPIPTFYGLLFLLYMLSLQ